MQIKTIISYYLTPVEVAMMIKRWSTCGERESTYIVGGDVI